MAATVSEPREAVALPATREREGDRGVRSQGELAIVWSRFRRHHFALVGLGALLIMVLVATLAPLAPTIEPPSVGRE